jgi:hypothetical protein
VGVTYRLVLLSVTAPLAACGKDSVQPVPIQGQHALASVDCQTLPVLIGSSATCDEVITDGSLIISPTYAFSLTINYNEDCSRTGGPIIGLALMSAGSVIQSKANLRFVLIVPGDTVDLYTGAASSTQLTMAFQAAGPLGARALAFTQP